MACDAGEILSFLITLALMKLLHMTYHFHAVVAETVLIINSEISESLTGSKIPFILSRPTCLSCSLEVALLADCLTEYAR